MYLLYTQSKDSLFYEPIYYVKYKKNEVRDSCMFDMENKFIMNIIYNINSKCVEYSNIDWKKVYDKYNVLHIKDIKSITLDNGFLIKNAIYDDYNKIYLVQLNNDLVLPIKQIGITDEYPLLKLTDVKLLDYSSSLN